MAATQGPRQAGGPLVPIAARARCALGGVVRGVGHAVRGEGEPAWQCLVQLEDQIAGVSVAVPVEHGANGVGDSLHGELRLGDASERDKKNTRHGVSALAGRRRGRHRRRHRCREDVLGERAADRRGADGGGVVRVRGRAGCRRRAWSSLRSTTQSIRPSNHMPLGGGVGADEGEVLARVLGLVRVLVGEDVVVAVVHHEHGCAVGPDAAG